MAKKSDKMVHQWTDKQKLAHVEELTIKHRNELPQEFLLVVDHPEKWIDWHDMYDRLHMALESVIVYVKEQWDVDEEDRQAILKVAGLPPDYIDYKAKFSKVQEGNLELLEQIDDLKEAEAVWKNDETARNRERTQLIKERDDLQAAYDLMLTEENPSEE